MSSVRINELPTEVLQKTLLYLQPLDLIRCRRVCSRWRDVVDSVVNEELWHQLCRQDFPGIYKDARLKCDPSMLWHELYKSLHLWGKLDLVNEENWTPICSSIGNFGVLPVSAIEGRLCVWDRDNIVYYDLKGKKVKEFNTESGPTFFKETESIIVGMCNLSDLVIVKKINGEPDLSSKVVIDDVEDGLTIVGEDVYYVKLDEENLRNQILVSKPENNYESALVRGFDSFILALSCKNDILHVILDTYDVFVLKKDKFVFQEHVGSKTSRYILNTYNIQYSDDRLLDRLSDEVGFNVTAYYFYVHVAFLGGDDSILRLYNTEQFLDNPRIAPLYKFDIAIRLEPCDEWSKVRGVDIMEKENGHIILVAIDAGVFAIELTHSSNRRSARIKKNLINTETKKFKKILLRE